MELVKRSIVYAITDIDVEDFIAWNHGEFMAIGYCTPLNEVMEKKLPVFDVDYNGQFGNNLFYTVNIEDDTPELHEKVRAMLVDAIKTAKANNAAREKEVPPCECGEPRYWHDCCQTYQCYECDRNKCKCKRK